MRVPGSIKRRLFALVVVYSFATGSAFFWNTGSFEVSLIINLTVATLGLVVLHFRWRSYERRALTPKKARDIFS